MKKNGWLDIEKEGLRTTVAKRKPTMTTTVVDDGFVDSGSSPPASPLIGMTPHDTSASPTTPAPSNEVRS
jgi:hypothetical protein